MPDHKHEEKVEPGRGSTSTERHRSYRGGTARGRQAEAVSVEQAVAEYEDLERELSRKNRIKDDVDVEKGAVDDGASDELDLETAFGCGLASQHVGVCWDRVTVRGVAAATNYVETLPDALLRLVDAVTPLMRLAGLCSRPAEAKLLSDIRGVCRPGEMVLVLGKPGAGCSTLLRVVANQRRGFTAVDGSVRYGPWPASDFGRAEAVYNAEEDAHLATLTVEQTLAFALDVTVPGATPGSRQRVLDMLLRIFNMEHARTTAVGHLSGGERRRVSMAEMMVTRACVQCWDNSTRGLDASTALDFVRSLRVQTDLYRTATLVSLYQASESIYRLFDRVLVLAEGRQVYFGPAAEARAYFDGLGFVPASPRQTTADYLVACADGPDPDALSESFGRSAAGARLEADLTAYLGECHIQHGDDDDDNRKRPTRSAYRTPFRLQLWALARRQFALKLQDRFNLTLSWVRSIVIALVLGSLYRSLGRTSASAFSRGGLLFGALFFNALQAFSELAGTMLGRAVVDKHRAYGFHRPSALWIAQMAVDQAFAATEILAFSVVVYLMTELVRDAAAFFIFYLLLLSGNVAMTLVFRIIGCLSRDFDRAIRVAVIVITLLVTTSGYMVQYEDEKPWLRWMSWLNVLGLIFGALMENEFGRIELSCAAESLVPSGPGYDDARHQVCTLPGSRPGTLAVRGSDYIARAFSYRSGDMWRNWGIVAAVTIVFLLLNVVLGELVRFDGSSGSARVSLRPDDGERRALNERLEAAAAARRHQQGPHEEEQEEETVVETRPDPEVGPDVAPESVLAWQGLTYDVPTTCGRTKRLLAGIDGFVRRGELTALMGASGAGKTTLLDVLVGRKTVGVVGGRIRQWSGRVAAYAEQQPLDEPTQTVREALRFSADLRQRRGIGQAERHAYVEHVLVMLEMEALADCIIGQGLTVEERKRVSIGVELAARPERLLFLDEPTSGLDSRGALNTVRLLRKLAAAGLAVVCTIHQPDADLFGLFDRLLLMQRGGRVAYFGETGPDAAVVRGYFARHGAEPEPTDNVAEFMLEAVGAGSGRRLGDRDWAEVWDDSPERAAVVETVSRLLRSEEAGIGGGGGAEPGSASVGRQLRVVTTRAIRSLWRSPDYVVTRLLGQLAVALVSGLTFLGLDDSRASLQKTVFVMFQVTVVPALVIGQVEVLFHHRRAVAQRETAAGMYPPGVFAAAMAAAEVPVSILCAGLFFSCIYLAPGLSLAAPRAGYQFLMILVTQLFSVSLGQAVAALTPSSRVAAQLDPLLVTVLALFCGVTMPASQMPALFRSWLHPLDPLTRLIGGMVTTALHGLPVRCRPNELSRFSAPEGVTCASYMSDFFAGGGRGYLAGDDDGGTCEYCAYKVGDEFYGPLGMSFANRWRDLGIFAVFVVTNLVGI
ncbi:hypothetical protein CDD80_3183 [Ophiocordyceps camponoti-rufipedis]|uniref:ABC transporter domain-containing protein n=1 Tax=Ophiocordyceps camponoti-rufipedis TaxID=2004952 RepID=A0A2C5Z346_9HYPO|nr:hypothetical protein CDD80_3183 [Ophiocordyceps camponoti-rufipedis]